MGTIHIVFGPQGAGKSTYARQLAAQVQGVHFSIDEWMQQLFGPDLPKPLSFPWVMERVQRCEQRIWATALAYAKTGGNAILDLGFMQARQRSHAQQLTANAEVAAQFHFVNAPHAIRRERVLNRNTERGETFAFEVTPAMFDFMEQQFQHPNAEELAHATVITTA